MTAPGWYHADGDPAGTHRYWDGIQWQGDATLSSPHNEIEYYAPSETEIDLGDVATRISLKETDPTRSYAQSPYSVSKSTVNVRRHKPLPEGLKNLTILVCVLRAIPLFSMAAGVLFAITRRALSANSGGRFAPPGLDFNTGFAVAVFVLFAVFALGAGLTIAQGRAAIKDQASNLFAIALIMMVIDVANAANQWVLVARGLSAGASLLATVILILQGLVTAWAGLQSRRK